METPVSPAARWTLRLIIAFSTVLWACLGKVDIVAGPGQDRPRSHQGDPGQAETAVVTRIHVTPKVR